MWGPRKGSNTSVIRDSTTCLGLVYPIYPIAALRVHAGRGRRIKLPGPYAPRASGLPELPKVRFKVATQPIHEVMRVASWCGTAPPISGAAIRRAGGRSDAIMQQESVFATQKTVLTPRSAEARWYKWPVGYPD